MGLSHVDVRSGIDYYPLKNLTGWFMGMVLFLVRPAVYVVMCHPACECCRVGGYFRQLGLSFVLVCWRLKGLVSFMHPCIHPRRVGAGPACPSLRRAFRHGIGPRAPHPGWNMVHNCIGESARTCASLIVCPADVSICRLFGSTWSCLATVENFARGAVGEGDGAHCW